MHLLLSFQLENIQLGNQFKTEIRAIYVSAAAEKKRKRDRENDRQQKPISFGSLLDFQQLNANWNVNKTLGCLQVSLIHPSVSRKCIENVYLHKRERELSQSTYKRINSRVVEWLTHRIVVCVCFFVFNHSIQTIKELLVYFAHSTPYNNHKNSIVLSSFQEFFPIKMLNFK